MSISGIYALTNQGDNTSDGSVDIKLQINRLNTGRQEETYNDQNRVVSAGEVISFIPKVLNLGEDCYLRVKVEYVNENTNFLDHVTGFSNDFEKNGEYYYYNKVFKTDEVVKIFDTIKIPEDVTQRINDKEIILKITAEAIQGKDFVPDYTLDDPWKNFTTNKSVTDSYDIGSNGEFKEVEKSENTHDTTLNNPKTGDSIDFIMVIFFVSLIGLIVVMFLSYKEKKKNI